ncbi:MAG: hypothetical protein NC238_00705 [Dehalobacter sp.]|nr:hypothetical protein [Dehalobacter sp.]
MSYNWRGNLIAGTWNKIDDRHYILKITGIRETTITLNDELTTYQSENSSIIFIKNTALPPT